ncbi:antibiotic biosynthesis monooxygenase family protein [Niabella beijingensis]|uniref:antibiotic biosynthesis monooxygenase family protein n=1 Tax=Niabella beijingensis TaxID=2872700 RepID=UPI001CBBBEF3|nr:antibiotic biosynthesis monooxygenase [Niabella beijingensis]MBZ4188279.1 antibiotic biosynthesis monooxygenase [Niabella beijingensis]
MVTEIAILNIRPGMGGAFEASFEQARNIIRSMKGYLQHELLKCMEEADKYILIVQWQHLEDHTEGFRKSSEYQEWKKLLHHFYDPFPVVEHYQGTAKAA